MKNLSLRRLCLALLLCALIVIPAGLTPTAAEPNFQVQLSVQYGQAEARGMLTSINAFRTGGDAWYWNSSNTQKTPVGKLTPLSYSYDLEKVAMLRAAEIALTFDHTRPNGESCFSAANELGIKSGSAVGENIAVGYSNAESVFLGWREDDKPYTGQGHRRNMLGDFTHVGIGHAMVDGTHFWVQEFGRGSTVGSQNADGNALVPITVSPLQVKEFLPDEIPTLFLAGGEKKALPAVTGKLRFGSSWSRPSVLLPLSFTGDGGNHVFLKDGVLTGHVAGSVNFTASLLGKTIILPVTVTSTAHSFGEWITDQSPSCTVDGASHRKCTLCGETEEKRLPSLGHDYKKTPTADGRVSFVCSRCGLTRTYLPGDVNEDGKVNSADRTALARHLANWSGYSLSEGAQAAADLNGDGKLNAADRTILARVIANWEGYVL